MRLLTLDHVPESTPDVSFRASRLTPLMLLLICAALCGGAVCWATGVIPRGRVPVQLPCILAGMFFLWTAGAFAMLVWAIRSKVWNCQTRGDTMWIRCSGKRNGLVAELKRADLLWAQPIKLTYVWKTGGGGRQYEFYQYMDLGLSADAAAVIEAFVRDEKIDKSIRDEFAPPIPVYQGGAWMLQPNVLRTCWADSPRLAAAIKFFPNWTEVRPLRKQKMTND